MKFILQQIGSARLKLAEKDFVGADKQLSVIESYINDFRDNERLKNMLDSVYKSAKEGKTIQFGFNRRTKGIYEFNIKLKAPK
jgi:hypothetical protein